MNEIIELLKNMEMQIKELSAILDCKNGTIASLAEVRDGLKEENAKLKEKLERVERILIRCTKSILVKRTNSGCKECECTGVCEEYLLKIIRGEE